MLSLPLEPHVGARLLARAIRLAYSPDQPRDETGKWSSTGADIAKATAALRDLSPHPDATLAAHGYRANPLNVVGSPSAKAAWTDKKDEIEGLFAGQSFGELLARGVKEEVAIDSLSSYQTWTNGHSIEHHLATSDWLDRPAAVVVAHGGRDWVVDGNNRLSVLRAGGAAKARVLRINPTKGNVRAAEGLNPTLGLLLSRDPERWFQDPEPGEGGSLRAAYDPNQPRDDQGQWTDTGASALSEEHTNALEAYADFSMQMNSDLREGKGDKHEGSAKLLDEAINVAEPLPAYKTYYRGGPRSVYGTLKHGDIFEDKAFVSVSKSREVGETFLGITGGDDILVEIETSRGSKGIDVNKTLGNRSPYPDQEEIVLARGTKFRVVSANKNLVKVQIYRRTL